MDQAHRPDIRHENQLPTDFEESRQRRIAAEIAEKAYRRGFQQGAYFVSWMVKEGRVSAEEAEIWATRQVASWRYDKPTNREILPPVLGRIQP